MEIVRARIDPDLKAAAKSVLADMGLSISDAIRMLLVRVAADGGLPFEARARVPNAETQAAMRELDEGGGTRYASVATMMADLDAADS